LGLNGLRGIRRLIQVLCAVVFLHGGAP
jgi:hypothetical protein